MKNYFLACVVLTVLTWISFTSSVSFADRIVHSDSGWSSVFSDARGPNASAQAVAGCNNWLNNVILYCQRTGGHFVLGAGCSVTRTNGDWARASARYVCQRY